MAKRIVRLDGKTYRVGKVFHGVGMSDSDMDLVLTKSMAKKVGKKYIPVKNISIRSRLASRVRKS